MYPFHGGGGSGSLEMEGYVGKASKWGDQEESDGPS